MKKNLIVCSALLIICTLFVACSSFVEHVNVAGIWDYTRGNMRGRMKLTQQGGDVYGMATDSSGKFSIKGKVEEGKLVLEGRGGDAGNFRATCDFVTNSVLAGTYTSSEGIIGKIQLARVQLK